MRVFFCVFNPSVTDEPTDQRTDRRMDRRTDQSNGRPAKAFYRVACAQLKIISSFNQASREKESNPLIAKSEQVRRETLLRSVEHKKVSELIEKLIYSIERGVDKCWRFITTF